MKDAGSHLAYTSVRLLTVCVCPVAAAEQSAHAQSPVPDIHLRELDILLKYQQNPQQWSMELHSGLQCMVFPVQPCANT